MGVMRKKTPDNLASIQRGIAVDSHRGIVYFDDSACRVKKYHNKGYRNVYSVVLTYSALGSAKKKKVIRLDYGQFQRAQGRYSMEAGSDCVQPCKMHMKEIRLLVSTFKGTKLVHEDVLKRMEYGGRKGGFDEGGLGEELV